jgi:glycosyltransferase involved in cell wall biosynthesis
MRGGQRQVLLLAQGLRERGHEQVILARQGSPLLEACRAAGLDARPLGRFGIGGVAWQADLVHAHDARAHSLGVVAPELVVSRRVAFPIGRSLVSRWKYRQADRYLAVSEFVRGQLVESGVPAELISVVYDGVEVRNPPVFHGRWRTVVAPASDDPRKGSDLAAEACRRAGLEVTFSTDLERDLPRAGVFLYLTHSEGLGSAILLAMALGTPVVASRVGGIPEVVEHESTGLLVENGAGAVERALRQVLADPAGAVRRAELAYARVVERFSAARMVARTEVAYQLVLGRPS